jgi:type IV secretory pathway VirB4 component
MSKNNNIDNTCTITEFAESNLKDNPSFAPNQDVYKRIYQFIGTGKSEGVYSSFFKKTEEFKSTDFICFDMAGLTGEPKLKRVLIPALLEMISRNILGSSETERKKLLVVDEAWNDLKGGAMKDFMESMYRCVRKLNGNISIITQNFIDVLNSTIGEALLVNTSFYWFVGNKHKPEPLFKASASNRMLTPYDVETIIHSTSKRDFYLLTPFFSGLLKFYPSKEFCILATTNAEEKNMIRKHREKLGVEYVTPEVIESVLSSK